MLKRSLSASAEGYRWSWLGPLSSCLSEAKSQMVTWDGDQVLQLLLQVHDVIAELNVIHPGETGHRATAGYIGRTCYALSTTPVSTKRM